MIGAAAPRPVALRGDADRATGAYLAALASMAAVDLALSGAFAAAAGKPQAVLLRLPEVLLILIGLNLWGGWLLFRPIRLFLLGRGAAGPAAERLARLTALTGWWALGVSALFAAASFFVTPFLVWDLEPTADTLAVLAARAIAWVVLLPTVAYFLAHERIRILRRWLERRRGLRAEPGTMRLGAKLAAILAAGALTPGLSIAVTLALVPPISPISGQPRELIIAVTLIGAGLAMAAAFHAMWRSIDDSLSGLLEGLAEVRRGDFGRRLTVQTDDELGRLAEGFNAFAEALGSSQSLAASAEQERMKAAARFHEAQKQSALGRLAAGVAHDFNNILAIIMGYADAARRRMAEDDRNRARLQEVLTAAERGRDLIAQILAFARSAGPERRAVDLTACVGQSAAWLGTTLGAAVRLEATLPQAPLRITGDATSMHQLVANLCVNAAQAMKGGGALTVTLARTEIDGGRSDGLRRRIADGGPSVVVDTTEPERLRSYIGLLQPGPHALLTVADEGCGMDAETIRHVFEPYFTTKPVGEGTGLGLAAVLGIVTQHEGAIALETRPGGGATFRIFIPLRPDADAAAPEA
jgi:signal transduction histidine kinase